MFLNQFFSQSDICWTVCFFFQSFFWIFVFHFLHLLHDFCSFCHSTLLLWVFCSSFNSYHSLQVSFFWVLFFVNLICESSSVHHSKFIVLAETDNCISEHNISSSSISNWSYINFTERVVIEYIILLFRYVFLTMSRWQDLSISHCVYYSSTRDCHREECKNNSWEAQQSSTRWSQRMIQ